MSHQPPFWEKRLEALSSQEWEALCDGCGLCCLNKLEDEDDGEIYYTRVACNLLDLQSGACQHYCDRHQYVPECISLQLQDIAQFRWLPQTCAYRLRAEGQSLPAWHHLISGDRSEVREIYPFPQLALLHESALKDNECLEDFIIEEITPNK